MKVQNTLMILGMFNLSTAVVAGSTKNLRGNSNEIPEGVILLRDLREVTTTWVTEEEATMNPTLDEKLMDPEEATLEPTLDRRLEATISPEYNEEATLEPTLDATVQEENTIMVADPDLEGKEESKKYGHDVIIQTSHSSEATMEPTLDATLDADEQDIAVVEHDESMFTTVLHEGEEFICQHMKICWLHK